MPRTDIQRPIVEPAPWERRWTFGERCRIGHFELRESDIFRHPIRHRWLGMPKRMWPAISLELDPVIKCHARLPDTGDWMDQFLPDTLGEWLLSHGQAHSFGSLNRRTRRVIRQIREDGFR